MPGFECIFFLEHAYLYIIEVRRTGLPENAEISDRFKWLRIEKETMRVSELRFASTDSSGEIEERYFSEGYLKFSGTTGTFIEKYNSAQHPLDRRTDFRLPAVLGNAVTGFLRTGPPATAGTGNTAAVR